MGQTNLTCFIMMLILRELMDPSIRTFSFSFLLIVTGVRRSSLLLLPVKKKIVYNQLHKHFQITHVAITAFM